MNRWCMILAFMMCLVIPAGSAQGAASGSSATVKSGSSLTAPADWRARWNQMVAGAKKEGTVVLYGDIGPTLRVKLGEAFKRKFGVDTEFVPGKPPEIAPKYLTERTANLSLCDILITGQTTTLTVLKPRKVLASPRPSLILPEVLDSKAWPNGALPFLDKDQLALALIAGYVRFITINTELVKEGEITSYADLLNPKWKGKIVLFDPSIPGNGGTWLVFTMLKAYGREAGEKYLRQLAQQGVTVTRDARFSGESVARGKYAIGIGTALQVEQDLAQAHAPIAWAHLKEGGMVIPGAYVVALPDKPAHPNAAALMMNFLLSKEGQQIASDAMGLPAMRRDLTLTRKLEETMPKAGDKVYWLDEEVVLTEPTFYPLAREIFHIQ